MGLRIAVLPGDGVGPDVVAAARAALDATGLELVFDEIPCGGAYYLRSGREWPEDAIARCEAADAILLGAVGWPHPDGSGPVTRADGELAGFEAVIGNRRRFDLFANVRPVRLLDGLRPRVEGRRVDAWRPNEVDLVIVRENTEDLYIGAGSIHRRGGRAEAAVDTRLVTRLGTERVVRLGFELARTRLPRGRPRKVTAVAKPNLLDGCRLFVEVFREVAAEHPEIEAEVAIVDAFAAALVTAPSRYDVVVTPNLFGDILTDLAAVLQGGMGMAVGMNLGERRGMFEPVHGSAPDLAGRDVANPLAAILAGAELLRWSGRTRDRPELTEGGDRIEAAVRAVVRSGAPLPADLVGAEAGVSTSAVAAAVADRVRASARSMTGR